MTQLIVCLSCRISEADTENESDGVKLHKILQNLKTSEDFELKTIKCMSGCRHSCTLGLSAQDKPSYLFGDLEPTQETAEQALAMAQLYCEKETGFVTKGERPSLFKESVLARVPTVFKG